MTVNDQIKKFRASEPAHTMSVTQVIRKVRSEIVLLRDSVAGCYECINNCAIDHVEVDRLDSVLALLDNLKEEK